MSNIMPVITLYQPWATWIMRGWKLIETRTHNKFHCLQGTRICIHSGLTTDAGAANNPYLTKEQVMYKPHEMINGFILCSAFVKLSRELKGEHSKPALIDCSSVKRYGLFLTELQVFKEPIQEKGSVGIWYFDFDTMQKVKKPHTLSSLQKKLF